MRSKVAIQGIRASFHEEAATKFFGNGVEVLPCLTFGSLFGAMRDGEAEYAVCAFENALAGSILPNYALLRNSDLEIFGEVYLCIEMHLMALSGQTVDQIEEIHSHPMALLQCRDFLDEHPDILSIESSDTASSAREIHEHHIRHRAAIAGRRAAEVYGLDILVEGIHDNKRNFTRFLALRRRGSKPAVEGVDKASLSFRTAHDPGSLARILTTIGERGINMNKIQSLPVVGEEWRYYFWVDLRFEDEDAYRSMLREVEPLTHELRILGEYRQGEKPV